MTSGHSRIAKRKSISFPVLFCDEFGNGIFCFTATNLSTSGIFIETDLQLDSGMKTFISFTLPFSQKQILVASEVKRTFEKKRGPGRHKDVTQGIGLSFLDLQPEDFEAIHTLIGAGR